MNNKTYAGIPEEFSRLEQSKIVLIPVPYSGAKEGQKASAKGPEAFLKASENMELYDLETDTEVYQQGVYLADAITDNGSPEDMIEAVHETTKKYIKKNKFVTLFGGDHSVSIGAIRAFNQTFKSLTVLQIDAHANLRKSHEGSKYNAACAAYEANQITNLIQVGVRSIDPIEKTVMDEEKTYFSHEMAIDDTWMDSAIDQMTDNVYITFDFDALDPSIMPSVNKPEPGGLFWYETLDFLKKVFDEKNVVGFDMVDLSPNDVDKSSDVLASRLFYKMISYKFLEENIGDDYDNTYEGSKQKNNQSKFEEDDEY